jgi:hypothetical protein
VVTLEDEIFHCISFEGVYASHRAFMENISSTNYQVRKNFDSPYLVDLSVHIQCGFLVIRRKALDLRAK